MDNKQTAVEWLVNNLHEIGVNHNLSIKAEKGWLEKRNEIIDQAKQMEKEQIIDAWDNGFANGHDLGKYNDDCSPEDAQQYYNETYTND